MTSSESHAAAPLVSIVVPAYNRERFVGATLDSVIAQTFQNWELVLFDDGSADATDDVGQRYASKDPRIRMARGRNGGVAAARNRGFALTDRRSAFVIFFDSDDVWEPEILETLIHDLDAHPDHVGAHAVARCIDQDGQLIPDDDLADQLRRRKGFRAGRLAELELSEPTTFAELAYHNWVVTPGTLLLRRHILETVGEFDVATDPADDWDLAIRVSRLGPVGFVDRALLNWRRHPDTVSATSPRWRRVHFRVRTKALTDRTNTPEQARSARHAYLSAAGSSLLAARDHAAHRDYRSAARAAGKAAHVWALYLGADVRSRLRTIR